MSDRRSSFSSARASALALGMVVLGAGFLHCSTSQAAESRVVVAFGESRRGFGAAELATLSLVEISTEDHGKSHTYRGVAIRDLLALVDAPLGEKLRGPALSLVVRVQAADGYVAAFALAEFDAAFRKEAILLVDRQDGAPLPEGAGPWRLVCAGDTRGARWVRQVVSIEVVSLPAPQRP